MKSYITEFVGTFLFVFSIALAVAHAGALAPLVIGAALMSMVYMGGHISGGHYNPAVTLAVYLRGKLGLTTALGYAGSQFAGATLAAALAPIVTHQAFLVAPGTSDLTSALMVETLFTFALVLVVLDVATDDAVAKNSFYGLAIGFTIVVAAFAGGSVSGGAFNPAVGLGAAAAALDSAVLGHAWLYLVGPVCGALLATLVYHLQHPNEAV
ncbi:aquaporin [Nannocystis sp. SCPEA4]|uniref:MIP/aquaporin family protein n=1 Tax=Nannocystis sp. SCPEA4 TaxID=2996787 RepID=UPI002272200C|nr:aquaporin [Nannocystis sp. SCPEA4]MCY1058926.1 aquaporin [Nannocystis sp. SCPEA4]